MSPSKAEQDLRRQVRIKNWLRAAEAGQVSHAQALEAVAAIALQMGRETEAGQGRCTDART